MPRVGERGGRRYPNFAKLLYWSLVVSGACMANAPLAGSGDAQTKLVVGGRGRPWGNRYGIAWEGTHEDANSIEYG